MITVRAGGIKNGLFDRRCDSACAALSWKLQLQRRGCGCDCDCGCGCGCNDEALFQPQRLRQNDESPQTRALI